MVVTFCRVLLSVGQAVHVLLQCEAKKLFSFLGLAAEIRRVWGAAPLGEARGCGGSGQKERPRCFELPYIIWPLWEAPMFGRIQDHQVGFSALLCYDWWQRTMHSCRRACGGKWRG